VPNSVTVVVAAMDEENTIGDVIRRCQPFARHIVVVDGHSRDQTAGIAASLGVEVIRQGGRGKGDALRCAISRVTTDMVVFIDADGSHVPEDIPKLIAPILKNEADHVSASRLMGGSEELHGGLAELARLIGAATITVLINLRFRVRLSESQNGFRAIRTDVLRELSLCSKGTTIEQEMIMATLRLGYRMAEVPSHELPRRFGESHIRLHSAWLPYVLNLFRNLLSKRSRRVARRPGIARTRPPASSALVRRNVHR